MTPRVAVAPSPDAGIAAAVRDGGGDLADPETADALVWTHPLDPHGLRDVLERSPARWIQLPFAGIEGFVEAGVIDPARTWTCTKGAYGYACAEHALTLMLAARRCLHDHMRATSWRTGGSGTPERLLRGATLVLIGTGGIGRALVRLLEPFEVTIVALNRSGRPLSGAERTATPNELVHLLPGAHLVVLAAALTPATRKMIDREALDAMHRDAWLINVARGGLVDTEALVEVLTEGSIAGAALDVTDPEPLPDDHALWGLDNAIITPHVANTWDMALPALRAMVRANVARFARGDRLEGIVDVELGY